MMKNQNIDFIKKQMENNRLKKDLLDYEEQKQEQLQLREELKK
jgi:hypothetical protein